MNGSLPYDPRRFRHAAPHYLEGRPAYAARLIDWVAEETGLGPETRVLDLGCGPGQLARAFAARAGEAIGVDPEPEMLRVARAQSSAANLRYVEGSSFDLDPGLGPFRLVVIGRAFHWMDRPATLARLDGMVEMGGAVALFEDEHPEVPENAWRSAYQAVIERFAAGDPVRQQRKAPGWMRHEAALLGSAFSRLTRIGVIERRETPVRQIVARALSMSSISRAHLGDKVDELAREIVTLLANLAPDGHLAEIVESQALIARRP